MRDTDAFWIAEGLRHLKPDTGETFPEEWDVSGTFREIVGGCTVLEFGCGIGRLCGTFDPNKYLGVDINPDAIEAAREQNPGYSFQLLTETDEPLPKREAVLAHTVLLHLRDEHLEKAVARLSAGSDLILVSEHMDRRWRRAGDPPVFNRDPEAYILRFQKVGYALSAFAKYRNRRLESMDWAAGKDTRLTLLTFRKA